MSDIGTFLTHSAEWADSSTVLSIQGLLEAHRAHATGAGVAIETTAGGTHYGHCAWVGLLSHVYTEDTQIRQALRK